MFTRNMIGKITFGTSAENVYRLTVGNIYLSRQYNSNINGNSPVNEGLKYNETGTGAGSYQWGYNGLVLGTGTIAPSIDDYKMGAFIGEDVLHYSQPIISTPSSNVAWSANGIFVIVQDVQNITENPVTITEVGVYNTRSNTNTSGCILITRDVISPVTIAPNETKTFVLRWDLAEMATNIQVS